MKRVDCIDPDRLIYRQPCGWGALMALPLYFFFTAVGVILWGGNVSMIQEGIGALIFFALFGIWTLFVVGSAIHWFSRIGFDIDRVDGTVTTQWGMLTPIFPSTHRLAGFHTVMLGFQTRQCGRSKIHEYTVLLSDHRESPLQIGRGADYPRMRTVAEDVARFLELPLIDESQGEARFVDLRVHERRPVAGYRAAPVLAPPPPLPTLRFERQGDEMMFRLPAAGYGCFGVFMLLVVFYVGFLIFLGTESNWNWKPMAFYAGVFGLVLAVMYGGAAPTRHTIVADPDRLRIVARGFVFSTTRELAWNDVKEVTRSSKLISLLTPTQTANFGNAALTEPEVIWMHDVLQRYWRG